MPPALFPSPDFLVAFSNRAEAPSDRLTEAEINPLFVLPDGHGVKAADGLVMFR